MKRWLMILLSLALAIFPALNLAPAALADRIRRGKAS